MNIESFYKLYKEANHCIIDSRKLQPNDIFFAFSGENYNAAEKAEEVIANGALAVVVEDAKYNNPGRNIFYVDSTLEFLQDLAIYHRNQLNIPIIGLTGSNGKTTTKEMISTVLSKKFKLQYTFGNLNNHIGVPLTILSIKPEHNLAVVEMGANHQKEIEALCKIAQPSIGYITNFGKAHLEGFGGFEGVINGKSELYDYLKSNNNTILVNEADAIQLEKTLDYVNKISFGKLNSHYVFEVFAKDHFVGLIYQGEKLLSNLTGNYNFTNLSAAVSLGLHFNIPFNDIKEAIESYFPSNMRSQVQKKNGKTLVLDTYNANPSSMSASLDNFNEFEGSKTIIIGDMLELGTESELEHQLIFDKAKALSFENIITVGKEFKKVNTTDLAFENTSELIAFLKEKPITTDNILLKASRGIALEKAIDLL
ncbi:UDP-N-acetylmuramoyl-tripeptide--D-alanyl-D-alanine ligase [Chryseobacterium sp. TY3]